MGYLPTVLPSHRLPSNTCAEVRFDNGSYTNKHNPLCVDQAFVEAYPVMNDNVNNDVENFQRIEWYTESNVVQINEVNCEAKCQTFKWPMLKKVQPII